MAAKDYRQQPYFQHNEDITNRIYFDFILFVYKILRTLASVKKDSKVLNRITLDWLALFKFSLQIRVLQYKVRIFFYYHQREMATMDDIIVI